MNTPENVLQFHMLDNCVEVVVPAHDPSQTLPLEFLVDGLGPAVAHVVEHAYPGFRENLSLGGKLIITLIFTPDRAAS